MKKGEEKQGQEDGILLNEATGKDEGQSTDVALIEKAFGESIEYEEISEIENSPINEPVKEGEVSDGFSKEKPPAPTNDSTSNEIEEDLPPEMLEEVETPQLPPKDAPEQVVNDEEPNENKLEGEPTRTATPIDHADQHAKIAADSFIGIANNMLEIGGGFFIKIKRKKSHIYFDELLERTKMEGFPPVVESIDNQNNKNFNRIKLDPTDVALLRPVLVEVLKNQTKQMTPEQQLAAVAISIAVKKGKAMMEIKAENKLFVQLLDERIEKHCERLEAYLEKEEEILNSKQDEGKEEDTQGKKAA